MYMLQAIMYYSVNMLILKCDLKAFPSQFPVDLYSFKFSHDRKLQHLCNHSSHNISSLGIQIRSTSTFAVLSLFVFAVTSMDECSSSIYNYTTSRKQDSVYFLKPGSTDHKRMIREGS